MSRYKDQECKFEPGSYVLSTPSSTPRFDMQWVRPCIIKIIGPAMAAYCSYIKMWNLTTDLTWKPMHHDKYFFIDNFTINKCTLYENEAHIILLNLMV